jgi:Tfp pilus assembly protein PilO
MYLMEKKGSFLERIRSWPERRKKVLIFVVLIILGILLFSFYLSRIKKKLEGLKETKIINTEEVKEKIQKQNEEQFKKLEEAMKEFIESVKEKQKNESQNENK